MKTKFLFAVAFAVTTALFAQKKEVKTLEKAIKSADYGAAKAAVSAAEALMGSMDAKTKSKFLLLKGQAFLGDGNKNITELKTAAEAFKALKGNSKYGSQAEQALGTTINSMISSAVDDQNAQQYGNASETLEYAYSLKSTDTIFLYYAATNAVSSKDYVRAVKLYEQLKDMRYSGIETKFAAVDAKTGVLKDDFGSQLERDLQVKAGEYIKPSEVKTDSKLPEIIKMVATLHIQNGDNEKALSVIEEAMQADPDDLNMLVSLSNVYLQLDRRDDFFRVMKELIVKDPTNPIWHFNIGVGYDNGGDFDNAKASYSKSIELNPGYADGYNNLANLLLGKDQKYYDEQNNLGTSKADNARYDELTSIRKKLHAEAVGYLEKGIACEFAAGKEETKRTMMKQAYQLYQLLDETAKADAVKAKIDAMN